CARHDPPYYYGDSHYTPIDYW
nr:immunoglobulin heavy chain junction region [Macaca mulatta]